MTYARDVDHVVAALAAGGVALIPTDTVYGLAADPMSARAMLRLCQLKNRPEGIPIAVLVGSMDQARGLVVTNSRFDELAARYWPGAVTLVCAKRTDVDLRVGTDQTVGVRMADHAFVRELVHRAGPVAATSANVHGRPTITDFATAKEAFGDGVDVIVDGGTLSAIASTVVDTTTDPPSVLRQGEVDVALGTPRFSD